jgi:hypothetical protein
MIGDGPTGKSSWDRHKFQLQISLLTHLFSEEVKMNARNVIKAIDVDNKLMVLLGLMILDGVILIGLLIAVWLILV